MSNNEFADRYGPVALVTGASSGIGRSFAEVLAAKGLDVVVVARRAQRLHELAARLEPQYGVKLTVLEADLSDAAAAQQIVNATASLDIGLLVSNAGYGFKGHYDSADPKAMAEVLMVNCNTPMLLARGFVPRLRQRGRGGILFTSSVEGFLGGPYSTVYAATKGFMNSLGEGLWGELTPEGISVLTLCPGATDTEAARNQGIDPSTLRNVMSPDDVASLALDNFDNGPTYIPSEHYRASFAHLLSMPRRDALMAMAKAMKPASAKT
ncbi:MAG: 3-oxoacyl-(Acyl-carrier-protein) reductase FabG [Hydrocarboniphaga sp.]|uniref:SDR family NAD(P)-dependent oxidoreductase n=1 Tax=Hydrocarboniphaga sp. TaxID=2033016 RepID=UPI00261631FC|nr:SDR family NAD(P)-dependent oxidoreductase [Hydrocarboniphaga sp.]MDB5970363.1 3-oxoacyl-(Acyl-carrier-protein) reductase FabG [Hydrocarboniphaga sp.]